MSSEKLCEQVEKGNMNEVISILDELKGLDYECILDQQSIEKLYDFLHKNRRNQDCHAFSMYLAKRCRNGKTYCEIDEDNYSIKMQEIKKLTDEESDNMKAILYHGQFFDFSSCFIYYGSGKNLRSVCSIDDLRKVLTLFGNSIEGIEEFVQYIVLVYKTIVFDKNIEFSLRRLEAPFIVRRHEILYHLYCIEKEIPDIISGYGLMDNQSLGEKMTIPCSPERSRQTVKNKLTKEADNGVIKCELHTKMEKIGSNKPDRIYFCACIPEGIKIDNILLSGRIYIYQITQHV